MMRKSLIVISMAATWIGSPASANPLFESEEPLQAVLTAPITQAYRQAKRDTRLYLEGSFSYVDGGENATKVPVKIRTRGNFRRTNCKHPPLRLNFKKKGLENTLLEGQNKLKLVGTCRTGKSFQSLVALEYLIYKMFEQVSDYHFKTRLLELSYIDSDNKRKPRTETTFVIEDVADMAKRSNMVENKVKTAARTRLDHQHAALLELFQLMISNYDYSMIRGAPGQLCCHNVRILSAKSGGEKLFPVPYDFDVSGFVNAPYATAPDQYKVSTVRTRKFTGFCKQDKYFHQAIATMNERKPAIYAVIEQSPLLDDRVRKSTIAYLDNYYEMINDPKKVDARIIGKCRGDMIIG